MSYMMCHAEHFGVILIDTRLVNGNRQCNECFRHRNLHFVCTRASGRRCCSHDNHCCNKTGVPLYISRKARHSIGCQQQRSPHATSTTSFSCAQPVSVCIVAVELPSFQRVRRLHRRCSGSGDVGVTCPQRISVPSVAARGRHPTQCISACVSPHAMLRDPGSTTVMPKAGQ